eukprot:jgi/Psemu1/187255/e_gw1.66.141.1
MERLARVSPVNASWLLYSFLLLFRVILCPFLVGYVHPDEFFQGGQELFFGCPPTIPWEFEPSNALRSIIPPAFTTWLPLKIYNWFRNFFNAGFGYDKMMIQTGSLSGIEVLVVPRIACALLSFLAMDCSVWSICKTVDSRKAVKTKGGVPTPVLLLASAWPTMVMLTRPFSNSVESYVLALLMATILTNDSDGKQRVLSESSIDFFFCCKVGTICALGIFTRFTFVFFAFPILLFLLRNMVRSFGIMKGTLWTKLWWMAISFAFVALGIVWADTIFYSSRPNVLNMESSDRSDVPMPSLLNYSSFVLTPFNALAYNSKTSNLKDHGLHPRWTHAVVNMLIMYGPSALATYHVIATKSMNRTGSTTTSTHQSRKTEEDDGYLLVSGAVVIFGLGFLSLAPHQEPRFLLPLLLPLVLLGEKPFQSYPRAGPFIWVLFNSILFILFGVLHQGGVTQSLLSIGSTQTWPTQNQPTSWIYMRTYMPPTFLSRLSYDMVYDKPRSCDRHQENGVCRSISLDASSRYDESACQEEKVHIVDLKGSGLDKLWDTLQSELPCSELGDDSESNSFLYIVVPFLAENDSNDDYGFTFSSRCQLPNGVYDCYHVQSFGPHLTTEDFPPFNGSALRFYNSMTLNVYNISCAR